MPECMHKSTRNYPGYGTKLTIPAREGVFIGEHSDAFAENEQEPSGFNEPDSDFGDLERFCHREACTNNAQYDQSIRLSRNVHAMDKWNGRVTGRTFVMIDSIVRKR